MRHPPQPLLRQPPAAGLLDALPQVVLFKSDAHQQTLAVVRRRRLAGFGTRRQERGGLVDDDFDRGRRMPGRHSPVR
ncbi:MAG: hypothetical protein MZV65_35475 [Chromatiales bacterium]|nr:hypothetical protein [Chromatiales bacterium]